MSRKLIILIAVAIILFGGVILLRETGFGTQTLWNISNGGKWILPLVVVSSLIDSVNPCAFSILLLTIAFLFSLGKLRSNILRVGLFYILGVFIIYVLIGLGIIQALHFFNTPHFMAKVGAVLLIILSLISIINEYFPKFPVKLRIPRGAHHKMAELMEKGSMPTAFLLGGLVGLCEFPCTGGPYLLILGLLHDHATFANGLGYLILYNIIFVLPLILILLIAGNETLLEKVQNWKNQESVKMRLWGGIAMILLGAVIFML